MEFSAVKTELGFDRVVADLQKSARTDLGRAALEALPFHRDAEPLAREHALLSEWAARVDEGGAVAFAGSAAILVKIASGRPGEVLLCARELFELSDAIDAIAGLSRSIDAKRHPHLRAEVPDAAPLTAIASAIRRAVDRDGSILDSASPALSSIRRRLSTQEATVRGRLRDLLRGFLKSGVSVEDFLTERNGRLVIPVVSGRGNPDAWLVHDRSQSGATLYVEPLAVVPLNNACAALRMEEEDECRRIVAALNDLAFAERGPLKRLLEATGRLDALQARALPVARERHALPPVSADGAYVLREARHPHLKNPVPITLSLEGGERHAVISGANAGGKTVTLKTFGLFSLMFQHGMALPCHPDSRLPLFDRVLIDIGDRQSIEQDLSTFSAHVVALVDILKRLAGASRALVLLDELGVGSNPRQGAALACGILSTIHEAPCVSITTTHYESLIELAARLPHAVNVAVAFDPESVSPLFALEKGRSGISHSLKIARKFGMPEAVIECARTFLTDEELRLERLTAELEARERALVRERRRFERAQKRERDARLKLEEETRALQAKQAVARDEVAATIGDKVAQRLAALDRLVAEATTDAEKMSATSKRGAARRLAAELAEELPAPQAKPARKIVPQTGDPCRGEVGEHVLYGPNRLPGIVVERVDARRLRVEFASGIAMTLPASELFAGASPGDVGMIRVTRKERPPLRPELDLRGRSVEEALPVVEDYLDQALAGGLSECRLIHGKGTGRLAEGLKKFLAGRTGIASAAFAPWGQGDYGVTVVKFK